jgi:hypothetical protein
MHLAMKTAVAAGLCLRSLRQPSLKSMASPMEELFLRRRPTASNRPAQTGSEDSKAHRGARQRVLEVHGVCQRGGAKCEASIGSVRLCDMAASA